MRGERDAGAVRAHRRGEQAFRERGDGWELLERVEPVRAMQRAVLLRDEQSPSHPQVTVARKTLTPIRIRAARPSSGRSETVASSWDAEMT